MHTVNDTAYLVSPGVFQRYAQEHPEVAALAKQENQPDWEWVQKRFEKLQLHRKQPNGLNIWTCEATGPRKSRRLHGYLLEMGPGYSPKYRPESLSCSDSGRMTRLGQRPSPPCGDDQCPAKIGNIWRTELLGPRQLLCKERSGSAARRSGHLLRGARHHDAAAGSACTRPHVDHPIGLATARISCSIMTTVLPASTRRCTATPSSRSASDTCSPVVGSSSTYRLLPRWLR